MCEAKPGQRCAADTCQDAQSLAGQYAAAHPDGPDITPLAASAVSCAPVAERTSAEYFLSEQGLLERSERAMRHSGRPTSMVTLPSGARFDLSVSEDGEWTAFASVDKIQLAAGGREPYASSHPDDVHDRIRKVIPVATARAAVRDRLVAAGATGDLNVTMRAPRHLKEGVAVRIMGAGTWRLNATFVDGQIREMWQSRHRGKYFPEEYERELDTPESIDVALADVAKSIGIGGGRRAGAHHVIREALEAGARAYADSSDLRWFDAEHPVPSASAAA